MGFSVDIDMFRCLYTLNEHDINYIRHVYSLLMIYRLIVFSMKWWPNYVIFKGYPTFYRLVVYGLFRSGWTFCDMKHILYILSIICCLIYYCLWIVNKMPNCVHISPRPPVYVDAFLWSTYTDVSLLIVNATLLYSWSSISLTKWNFLI